jgi:site-specific DNA recombinase
MVCQKRSHKGKQYRYYICKTYHKFGRQLCDQANINADELEEAVTALIRNKLDKIPNELFSITANKEKDIERLQQEIKLKQTKWEKFRRDQVDLFGQRELLDTETYQQQMLDIKRQIQLLDEEITVLEKQIEVVMEQIAESTSLEHYIEEFKRLELDDLERTRVLLHEVIKRITLQDQHLDIEYHYDFGA